MHRLIVLVWAALAVASACLPADLAAQVMMQPIVSPSYIQIPPPQQEIITPAPAPSYVWVRGHWDRTPDSWNWVGGQWVQPPFSNAYWVPGYWQHQRGKFLWERAHWAAADQGYIVNKPVTVPPVYQEPVPVAPAPNYVWQAGHWEWRGTWVWVPGAYVAATTPNATWVPGQWVPGIDGTWNWSPAHWTL